ncbi:hypothetical protein Dimus_033217 [Dionaea muscipula]
MVDAPVPGDVDVAEETQPSSTRPNLRPLPPSTKPLNPATPDYPPLADIDESHEDHPRADMVLCHPHSSPSLDPSLLLHGRRCSSPSATDSGRRWRMMLVDDSGNNNMAWWAAAATAAWWSAMEDDVDDDHGGRGLRKKMSMAAGGGGRRRW